MNRESFLLLRQEAPGRWSLLAKRSSASEINEELAKEKALLPEAVYELRRRVEKSIDHAFEGEPAPETGQLLCKLCGAPSKHPNHTGDTPQEWLDDMRAEIGPTAWDTVGDVSEALREMRGEGELLPMPSHSKLWLPEGARKVESEEELRAALANGYSPSIPAESWPSLSPVPEHARPAGHRLQMSIGPWGPDVPTITIKWPYSFPPENLPLNTRVIIDRWNGTDEETAKYLPKEEPPKMADLVGIVREGLKEYPNLGGWEGSLSDQLREAIEAVKEKLEARSLSAYMTGEKEPQLAANRALKALWDMEALVPKLCLEEEPPTESAS